VLSLLALLVPKCWRMRAAGAGCCLCLMLQALLVAAACSLLQTLLVAAPDARSWTRCLLGQALQQGAATSCLLGPGAVISWRA
jgi:hypothetical protein